MNSRSSRQPAHVVNGPAATTLFRYNLESEIIHAVAAFVPLCQPARDK